MLSEGSERLRDTFVESRSVRDLFPVKIRALVVSSSRATAAAEIYRSARGAGLSKDVRNSRNEERRMRKFEKNKK